MFHKFLPLKKYSLTKIYKKKMRQEKPNNQKKYSMNHF